MGGSSQKTTQKTTLGKTTTANPYVVSKTNNKGTTSNFVQGSAFDTINNFVNSNMNNLLNDYLNPSLNSTTNQALLNNYRTNLNKETNKTFENNIVNPLSNRNMLRSSQATNMYKNLSNNINDNISNYTNELLANSQDRSVNMINQLLSAYLNGFDVLNSNQQQSLNTSLSNATRTTDTQMKNLFYDSMLRGLNTAANVANSAVNVTNSLNGLGKSK